MNCYTLKCLLGLTIGIASQTLSVSAQNSASNTADSSTGTQQAVESLPTISLGSSNAPVTIHMYYSLSCVHCKEFENTVLPKIKDRFIDTGQVYFVFHDFPTDPLALEATKIARCGTTADRYFSLVHTFFDKQDKWLTNDGAQEALQETALSAGLEPEQINICLQNKSLENAILGESLEARQAHKINYAPAFVVNGKLFEGELTEKAVEKLVSEANLPAQQ